MELRKALLSITAIVIVILFLGMSINPIQASSVEQVQTPSHKITGNTTTTALKAYSLIKKSNLKFTNTKIMISGSENYKVLHLEIVYSYSSAMTVSEMGGNITSFFHDGKVSVSFIGHKMYIKSSVQLNDKINLPNTYPKNVKNNPLIATDSTPGDMYYHIYTKSLSGYNAILAVTRVEVAQLTVYSVATIGIILGEVVAYQESAILTIQPESAAVLAAIALALTANDIYLYGYALIHHGPTIYIDEGFSYGTQWYNFYNIGAYGEEGIYMSNYATSNGLYEPMMTSYGPTSNSMIFHYGAWNPNAEPPW
jgi:hypothetical protein